VPLTYAARWTFGIVLLGALSICPFAAATTADKVRDLKQKAEAFEKQGDWDKACDFYEAILRIQRDLPEIKQRYIHCVRRLWQTRRHSDVSYTKEVLSIEYGQAVHLHNVVRDLLLDRSMERKKLTPARLFKKGLEELDFALADPNFCRQHVPQEYQHKVAEFRAILAKRAGEVALLDRKAAVGEICNIALFAEGYLGLKPTVVVMEFTCGACYALDEYTVYLTPTELRNLCSSLRGELIGIGITIASQDGKILIQEVELGSPAAKASLMINDQIVRIDKKDVGMLAPEAVMAMLEGPPGSVVELEVLSPTMGMRAFPIRREPTALASVHDQPIIDSPVGYIKIAAFQESTIKEIDGAIGRLTENGMKALVLDLRGNGGGLFESAVDVAKRFLSSGIIATKQHLDDKSNIVTTLCEAKNPGALSIPLVVLIDNDTASSAEVLAGALKENNRATVVGQPTFGKGCTQYLLKLPDFKGNLPAGGMRLTVAKVFSPKGLPYTGRGVQPDIAVELGAMPTPSMMQGGLSFDAQLSAGVLEAQRLLSTSPR
jgi:carboxyl-terminal processing protease